MVITKTACYNVPIIQVKRKGQSSLTNRLNRCGILQRVNKFLVVRAEQRKKFNQASSPGKGSYDNKLKENILLNKRFLKCQDPQELLQILQKQQGIMNYVNVSTAAVVIARNILSDPKNRMQENNLKNIDAAFTILCQLIIKHIDKMDVQGVSNCLWSLGKAVDILGPQKIQEYKFVFQILCSRAMTVSNYMTTQNTGNILWAMAKFKWDEQQQIQTVIRQAVNATKENYQPQEIVNILWAMATLKYQKLQAIEYFVNLAKKCVHDMNQQGISNLFWALQQLRFYDKELNLEVENIILHSDKRFSNQNICNIAMAFTDFGLEQRQKICELLVQQFMSNKSLNKQDLSNFLYALAQLNCPINLTQKVVNKSIAHKNIHQDIDLRQLMLAHIFYSFRKQKLLFPPDFEMKCKQALQDYTRLWKENSFVDDVFLVVQNRFEFSRKNVLIYDDQIAINIAVQSDEKNRVAVRVYPRQSYFVNCREKLIGRCQHHSFLLQQLGWQVVQVSAFKWNNNPQYQKKIIDDINAKLTQ